MKMLRVLLSCLSCTGGTLLSDDSVFEMISICYRMSRGRLSELLKKTAERTLTELVHIVFLVNNIHNKVYYVEDNNQKQNISQKETLIPPPSPIIDKKVNLKSSTDYITPRGIQFKRLETSSAPDIINTSQTDVSDIKPYGVGCVIKTFKFLVELTSINDTNIPESLGQISIQLLNTIVETQPQLIENIPSLLDLLCNNLCKSMLQNLHTDNLDRLNLTMRFFFNLYISLRKHLKMQFEVFFNNLFIFILQSKKFVAFEKQEIVLENLVQFFYLPSFMTDIFANYDCNLYCTNILEKLSKFLYKSAFPLNGSLYSVQLLSLECLLALLETISLRCKENKDINENNIDNSLKNNQSTELLHQRASKSKLIAAAEAFNKKPILGLKYIQEQKIVSENPSFDVISKFLRSAPRLDKKIVGEYIAKQDKDFINAFVKTFNFSNVEYVDAVRMFLTSFTLNGEAQIIDRIVESFAHHWFSQNEGNLFATKDVAYILCFSIVMLNVDAHNPGVKTKMTETEYIHRLRGINGGNDLPYKYLQKIYKSITEHEIKILDDSPSGNISNEKWNGLLERKNRIGSFITANVNELDKSVFLLVCKSITAALSIVFETTNDPIILDHALAGFNNCAYISSFYNISSAFDNVIINLCKFTSLNTNTKLSQSSSSSKLITLFGVNEKAHLATTSMFTLVLSHGDYLREGWRNIVNCLIILNEMDLLDNIIDDPFGNKKKGKKIKRKEEPSSTGLLSFISWGWSSSEPIIEEVNQIDLDAENAAKKTIENCSIKLLIDSTCQLQSESLVYLIKALILASTPTSGHKFNESNGSFCLELLTKITLINHSRINFVWILVSDHFANIVQMAKSPSEYVETAIVCLLLLCVTLAPKEEVSSHVFGMFELFLKLEPAVASAMSESIIIAVSRFLNLNSESIHTAEAWKIILALVERSASSAVAYERGFQALLSLIQTNDNKPSKILQEESFHPYLRAVLAYIRINEGKQKKRAFPAPPIQIEKEEENQQISIKAMNILYKLFEETGKIYNINISNTNNNNNNETENGTQDIAKKQIHQTKLWNYYWLPVFQALIHLCRDPRNNVRTHAMTLLQKTLLSEYLDIFTPEGIRNCFEQVMFPLLHTLLEPFPNIKTEEASIAVEETRVRAQQLLSKSLLQYLHQLTQLNDFHSVLWPQILYFIELYMKADQNGLLKEAIPEVVKNILLVMLQMNIFHPSNKIYGQDIWTISWMTIDGFCPSLKHEESFRTSLNAFQRVPISSQNATKEASNIIHRLVKEANLRKKSLINNLQSSTPSVSNIPQPILQNHTSQSDSHLNTKNNSINDI